MKSGATLDVVQIRLVAVVLKIKGDVSRRLRDRYNVLSQSVSDPGLVKHVWILAREIADDDMSLEYQAEYVLDHG